MKEDFSSQCSKNATGNHSEEVPSIIDCLDSLTYEVDDLTDRMHQIKAISIMAHRSLEQTLSCPCCSHEILDGVFKAIEGIAEAKIV